MKAKEFGAWPPHNDLKSGQRYSANGYNKSFKKERFPKAQEYANRNLEEYHRFDGTKDLTKEQDGQQSDGKQSSQSRKTDTANKQRQRMLQQVVGIVVGSTVIVTSYQAQVERREQQQVAEPIATIVENIDTEMDFEEDILEEIEVFESDENDNTTAPDSNNGRSGSNNSGGGGRSSGNSGRSTGNTSANANNDTTDSDEEDAELSETEESENNDENAEILPDNQEEDDDITDSDEQDAGGQDTNPSDNENSENDNAETPPVGETQSEKQSYHSRNSTTWEWSSDNSSVSFVIKTDSGNVISSDPATITTVEEPATCKEDGKITYTATINIGGTEYTDIRYEVLHALGHLFDSGKEVTTEGGHKAIRFECTRCHEYFEIRTSVDEE